MSVDLYSEALRRFRRLLARARKTALHQPAAMTVASADASGRVSARTVLLKSVDERGFAFFTNLTSRKGRQLGDNPRAALCFYWDNLGEQVMVEGKAEPVSEADAETYWDSRPRESQLGAWASFQSQPLKSRRELLARFAHFKRKFAGIRVPRPAFWSGLRVAPDRIEFWRPRPHRLNERVVYSLRGRRWTKTLLYP